MSGPKITALLITVRPSQAYVEHPEWDVFGKVINDLKAQTFKSFELIIVDGAGRPSPGDSVIARYLVPRQSYWRRHRKVSICAARNAGIFCASGELIVNLDDCCELPPDYLETFWQAWNVHRKCLASRWPEQGDSRADGPAPRGQVYGFGSYPREAALAINGYDEAFDGAQGLEDVDFSTRLQDTGVDMYLYGLDGFRIHAQSGWDPRAIDVEEPLVKCCNTAWHFTRALSPRRNTWEQWTESFARSLCRTPCLLLDENKNCRHHGMPCAYLDKGWPDRTPHPLWEEFLAKETNWPVFNLSARR